MATHLTDDSDYELEKALEIKRRDGSLIREKSRMLLEEGLPTIYARMSAQDVSTSAFMEIMKYLAELGDMKPKTAAPVVVPGAGFSITINVPQNAVGPAPVIIEGTASPVSSEETIDALPSFDDALPDAPPNFNTPDFQFNHDLMLPAAEEYIEP